MDIVPSGDVSMEDVAGDAAGGDGCRAGSVELGGSSRGEGRGRSAPTVARVPDAKVAGGKGKKKEKLMERLARYRAMRKALRHPSPHCWAVANVRRR